VRHVERDERYELCCLQKRSRTVHGDVDIIGATCTFKLTLGRTNAGQWTSNTEPIVEYSHNAPHVECGSSIDRGIIRTN
jgi:hypothetical protein